MISYFLTISSANLALSSSNLLCCTCLSKLALLLLYLLYASYYCFSSPSPTLPLNSLTSRRYSAISASFLFSYSDIWSMVALCCFRSI